MPRDPDLLALQINLTRHVLADALAERDRHSSAPRWRPRARRRRAAAEATIDEAQTILADLEGLARPVHAIILRTNGHHHLLHEPVTWHELHLIITDTIDTATGRHPAHPHLRLVMYLDDDGHHKGLPPNLIATALYGTGWPILGDVVLTTDDDKPIPDRLVDRLVRRRP